MVQVERAFPVIPLSAQVVFNLAEHARRGVQVMRVFGFFNGNGTVRAALIGVATAGGRGGGGADGLHALPLAHQQRPSVPSIAPPQWRCMP